jgi:hypothetical protein
MAFCTLPANPLGAADLRRSRRVIELLRGRRLAIAARREN